MPHKKYTQWIFISLLCIFVYACTTTQSSNDSMSKEKRAELYLRMGVRYLEMDMLQTAKERLESAVDLDSKNADIYNALGALHERLKQFETAGRYYEDAIALNSENYGIMNNYGRFLCERRDYPAGMELLTQALAMPLNNRKWFAYTNIGRCELAQGKLQLAESNFRQALQTNKSYAPALLEMQKISYRSGKYMSARAFLERYLAVAKHSAETLWYAVQTERSLGNKELAEAYREKLFNLFPASKEARQLKTAIR